MWSPRGPGRGDERVLRSFGFLADGHELVDEEVTSGGIRACFSDRLSLRVSVGKVRPSRRRDRATGGENVQNWTVISAKQKRDEEGLVRGIVARGREYAGA